MPFDDDGKYTVDFSEYGELPVMAECLHCTLTEALVGWIERSQAAGEPMAKRGMDPEYALFGIMLLLADVMSWAKINANGEEEQEMLNVMLATAVHRVEISNAQEESKKNTIQ